MTTTPAGRCCRSFGRHVEVLLLYWDNLDDFVGAARLKLERVGSFVTRILKLLLAVTLTAGSLWMTAREPLFGLGAVTLLMVVFFYYRVTTPPLRRQTT